MSTDPVEAPAGAVVTIATYESCPVTGVLRHIGDKWSPAVIRLLAERGYGFNELDRSIEGISRRMLTRTLRALEEAGFVSRTTTGPPPARVGYALTELGHSLREQLHTLGLWAEAHKSDLRFDLDLGSGCTLNE
ncbi:winged helix-turn-helix transcriptional regulator [Nonomuraea zeae]|uniref:Helix-turn-helix transcriptional regulator n=1 Tax=Nonomuraea zeae TaxID=1642303 RepID=A0A5S4GYI5_9ACTN|nr:helix-turn-helix domain-containing protein [Nonomuraea zeae]TMR38045.1 helix-turn-helix transcriptional regulator [Nonomuraea zeae]